MRSFDWTSKKKKEHAYSEPSATILDVCEELFCWASWFKFIATCSYFKWKENNLQPNALVSSEMQIRQVNLFSVEANETISGESC